MPISAFEEELPGSSITAHNLFHSTSGQILKVVAYAVSNNFPGDANRTEIYEWLKRLGTFSPDIIQRLQDSSNRALLQGLLRLAVEEGDVPLARTLLNAGANPNENVCVHRACPIPLTPLQYSCLEGNQELVRELLRANAQIDHPEFGWSCSPLLFAIYGCFERVWPHPVEPIIEVVGTGAGGVLDSDDVEDKSLYNDWEIQRLKALFVLIPQLLDAGADVNAVPGDLDDLEYSLKEWRDSANPKHDGYALVCEKHSALTLASSFRCPDLVDFLLRNGARVSFHIDGVWSALRECLCNSKERFETRRYGVCQHPIMPEWLFRGPVGVSKVIETAKRLIVAGVDVNDHKPCQSHDGRWKVHDHFDCYSVLDLGIVTQDRNLVDLLWSAGARPAGHSFDFALKARDYDTFCRLLESEAPFPEWALSDDEWLDAGNKPWQLESRKATERQKTRAMILAAIQLGQCASLRDLVRSRDCADFVGANAALQDAIEKCRADDLHDTLVCLLQSNILPQDSLSSVLGSSVVPAIDCLHFELVDVLLVAGADVNATHPNYPGTTPLSHAILCNHQDLVRKLLRRGAVVETPEQGNLLVEAICVRNHDIIQALLAHASPDRLGLSNERIYYTMVSPLAAAILEEQWSVFDQLLELGASVDPGSRLAGPVDYGTPLWAAVRQNNLAIAEWLLDNGAAASDELALKVAAVDKDPVFLGLLIKKLSTEERRGSAKYPLHTALRAAMDVDRLDNFRLILSSNIIGVASLSGSIHDALKSFITDRRAFLRSLLDAGACPDTIAHDDHIGPCTPLLKAISQQDYWCVKIILETRPTTSAELASQTRYTPLQLATLRGDLDIVQLLLQNDHDPNIVSHYSNEHQWGPTNRETTSELLGSSVQNATMETDYEIVKVLLQHGANPNSTTSKLPHTALQIACRDGSMELVELLLEYGANVNMPPAREFGATALQFAAIGGYLGIAHLLVEKGADVNAEAAEVEGRTALEGAAEHGRRDMVQFLRNAGAEISGSGDGQYERALRRARNNGHSATASLLESFLS